MLHTVSDIFRHRGVELSNALLHPIVDYQGPRSQFLIGGGVGTISDSILGGGGAQDTFSY